MIGAWRGVDNKVCSDTTVSTDSMVVTAMVELAPLSRINALHMQWHFSCVIVVESRVGAGDVVSLPGRVFDSLSAGMNWAETAVPQAIAVELLRG